VKDKKKKRSPLILSYIVCEDTLREKKETPFQTSIPDRLSNIRLPKISNYRIYANNMAKAAPTRMEPALAATFPAAPVYAGGATYVAVALLTGGAT
jgi:hypothetical protein